jgi:stage IV sporulation protein FB
MLGEPPPSQGDIHVNFFGIPIRIHPFFWVITALLGARSSGVPELLIWVMAVLVAILVHELGHALVVKAYGFHPWIVLYGMGGLTCHNPAENYRSKANTTLGQISISFAGPMAGFMLVVAIVVVLFMTGHRDEVKLGWLFNFIPFPLWFNTTTLGVFVKDLFLISILWGLINLLPVYPLDGGQIAREFLLFMNPQDGIRQSLMLSIFTALLVAVFMAIRLRDGFACLLFAYFAYENYMTLQAYSRGGR